MVVGGHHLLTGFHLAQQGVEPVGVLRAHHQIQLGHAAQQGLPFLLSDTAGHHQGQRRVVALAPGLTTQVAVHLLFGVIANRAGVVEHQIGLVFAVAGAVTHGLQNAGHPLGIGLVHLAAEGGDPVGPSGGVGHGWMRLNPVLTMAGELTWQGETRRS